MLFEERLELVDTHCHLNFDDYNCDRKFVVQRAKENGISKILIPAVDIETSKTAIEYASEFDGLYAAVGVHPNQGMYWTRTTLSELEVLAHKQKVVSIGEIGLDYYRDRTPKDLQRSIFMEQLQLAADIALPIIIHNREASDDILKIIKNWHRDVRLKGSILAEYPGVLHSFSGSEEFAREMISMNFKIGISGPVTFKKSQILQSVVALHSVSNMVLETDAPYLTPHPFRGKRNEPANVRIMANKIAEIKGIDINTVAEITTAEADKLFRWSNFH